MNKYKIVSLFLALALVASLVHLVALHHRSENNAATSTPADVKTAVLQNILSRKSVRSYTDQPVSREEIDTLLRAAMAAPTNHDLRPWKFVVADKRATIEALQKVMPKAKMLEEAAAVIVVCGDMSKEDKGGGPSKVWNLDCSAASENLLLMAEAMGLGAVWVTVSPVPDRVEAVRTALNLPETLVPFNLLVVGHPKGDPQPKDKYDEKNIIYAE